MTDIKAIEQLTDEDRAQVRADDFEGQTLTPKLVRIIDAQEKRIKRLLSQLIEWSNFDFDCPDEYNDETDEEEADGWALNRLYEETGKVIRGE